MRMFSSTVQPSVSLVTRAAGTDRGCTLCYDSAQWEFRVPTLPTREYTVWYSLPLHVDPLPPRSLMDEVRCGVRC